VRVMSDHEPTAEQPPAEPEPAQVTAPAAVAPVRPSLKDRVFGLRALVAVGLAGVILGGLAGFGINAATGGDDRDGRMGRPGPGQGWGQPGQQPGQPGQQPGQPGQLPAPPQGSEVPQPTPSTSQSS
jgi:hypothetical protein